MSKKRNYREKNPMKKKKGIRDMNAHSRRDQDHYLLVGVEVTMQKILMFLPSFFDYIKKKKKKRERCENHKKNPASTIFL